MSSCQSRCKESLGVWLSEAGASAWGVAKAEPVADYAIRQYDRWIASGSHGTMGYMERYGDVRSDPRLLLEGARSVIVAAFNYQPVCRQNHDAPLIADYALGDDYHTVLRSRLDEVARKLTDAYGGATRVCVDTAPLRERYWAVQSGVGFIGINNHLIVPGRGSRFFLAEILWTGAADVDEPCRLSCEGCMRCVRACPGNAIEANGSLCAARCLSYLTIEHRGELPPDISLKTRLYGCDVCQDVCPHNIGSQPTDIAEFSPRPALLSLTYDAVAHMTQAEFSAMFRNSAIKRAKLAGLQRNCARLGGVEN